jgi:hypothetical protein
MSFFLEKNIILRRLMLFLAFVLFARQVSYIPEIRISLLCGGTIWNDSLFFYYFPYHIILFVGFFLIYTEIQNSLACFLIGFILFLHSIFLIWLAFHA